MDTIIQSLAGLDNFALYFVISVAFLFVFKIVYAMVTPHDEWKLVKEEQNVAAATGFGGALIGFAIALSGAASNAVSIVDFALWGVIAIVASRLLLHCCALLLCRRSQNALTTMKFPQGSCLLPCQWQWVC